MRPGACARGALLTVLTLLTYMCRHMLTGHVAPTSGDAVLYGASVTRDISAVRDMMGVWCADDLLTATLHKRTPHKWTPTDDLKSWLCP